VFGHTIRHVLDSRRHHRRGRCRREGRRFVELDISLNDHIEPEAITRLANHADASWTLSFELPEHNVTVTSDGLVLVDGAHRDVWA
jgi:hypothetical protein